MGFQIAIADQQTVLSLEHSRLQEVARETLQAEGISGAEISIALVENARMHELNRDFLQHDYPTDVLSFLLDETTDRSGGRVLDGEIILSTEYARGEAAAYHWNPEQEVELYLVHGLLHLCGYDDQTESAQTAMRSRECAILARWGLVPHYRE